MIKAYMVCTPCEDCKANGLANVKDVLGMFPDRTLAEAYAKEKNAKVMAFCYFEIAAVVDSPVMMELDARGATIIPI